MEEGKNLKLWIGRADLIGDCIMALPILHFWEEVHPKSYKIWPIMRKCAQAASLFFNNPLIDKIHISERDEEFGQIDELMFNSCHIKTNVRPNHPFGEQWHNHRSMVEETWIQAGLPLECYHSLSEEDKFPHLRKWFNTEKREKTIAIHCFAGYGFDNHRSPSQRWWEYMICDLIKNGYKVIRLGHTREPLFNSDMEGDFEPCNPIGFTDLRHLSFIEQIQIALGCSAYIGTDSGFSLAMGAYSHPQVTLLTNWNQGHTENPLCLQPLNRHNVSLFNEFKNGGCSGINQELVLEKLKLLI